MIDQVQQSLEERRLLVHSLRHDSASRVEARLHEVIVVSFPTLLSF